MDTIDFFRLDYKFASLAVSVLDDGTTGSYGS